MPRPPLRIVSPCEVSDDAMTGSSMGAWCPSCGQEVHDVSRLTRAEVAALVAAHAGKRLCATIHVRADGAVRVADGYMHPTRTPTKRGLPVLAVAASLTAAACAPPVARRAPELVPADSQPVAPTVRVEPTVTSPAEPPPVAPPPPTTGPTPLATHEPETETETEPTPTSAGKPLSKSAPKVPSSGPKRVVRPPPPEPETLIRGQVESAL